MDNLPAGKNQRVLVVDDNLAIHEDFRKILSRDTAAKAALDASGTALFGGPAAVRQIQFEVDSADQGQEGVRLVKKALAAGRRNLPRAGLVDWPSPLLRCQGKVRGSDRLAVGQHEAEEFAPLGRRDLRLLVGYSKRRHPAVVDLPSDGHNGVLQLQRAVGDRGRGLAGRWSRIFDGRGSRRPKHQ